MRRGVFVLLTALCASPLALAEPPVAPSFEVGDEHRVINSKIRYFFQACSNAMDPAYVHQRDYQIERAEGFLASIHRRLDGDSNYDVTPLDRYLEQVKTGSADTAETAADTAASASTFQQAIRRAERPAAVTSEWHTHEDTERLLASIDAWKAEMLELGGAEYTAFRVADAGASREPEKRQAISAYIAYSSAVHDAATTVDARLAALDDHQGELGYLASHADAAWWEVAAVLAPSAEVDAARAKAQARVAAMGSLSDLRTAAAAAQAAAIDSVRMPAPVSSDPATLSVAEQAFANTGWGEELLRTVVTDAGWRDVRHPVSGAVIARRIDASYASRQGPDTCRLYHMVIEQPASGGSWGAPYRYSHTTTRIGCDNVR